MPYLEAKWQVYPGPYQPGIRYSGNNDNNIEEWLSMLGSRNPLPQFNTSGTGQRGGRKKTKRRRKKRRKTIKKRKRKKNKSIKRKNKTNKKH